MDTKTVIELVNRYSHVVKNHFDVRTIMLFGSYAKNQQKEDSDIDVAVIVDKLPEDILEAEFRLHKLRREIDFRIEPILMEYGNDPSGFLEEIYRTGIIVYQAA